MTQFLFYSVYIIASDSISVLKSEKSSVFDRNDNLATRAKKLKAIKSTDKPKRIQVKEINAKEDSSNQEVQFLIQVIHVAMSHLSLFPSLSDQISTIIYVV